MQITSRVTIGVHMLCAIEYFKEEKITSAFLAASVGANPVIVRMVMSSLRDAGLIKVSQGKTGITLAKPLADITLFDVYNAVENEESGIFNFHDNPNPNCPVGRNIHSALDDKLEKVQLAMENEMGAIHLDSVYLGIVNKENNHEQSR